MPEAPVAFWAFLWEKFGYNRSGNNTREIIMPIENEEQFQAEKASLIAQAEAADKRYAEAQARTQELMLDTQLEAAYKELGGIGNDDDREAYDAIKHHLIDTGRLKFENGKPAFFDKDGQRQTADETMKELKETSAYKPFFSSDSTSQADEQADQPKLYSREDARSGRASINDIASGRASVENTSGRPDWVPDTKRVNAGEVAKTKSRRWK